MANIYTVTVLHFVLCFFLRWTCIPFYEKEFEFLLLSRRVEKNRLLALTENILKTNLTVKSRS